MKILIALTLSALPVVAFANSTATGGGVPEIPAGAAPAVVAAIAGTVFWIRHRSKSKKKD